MNPSEIAAQDSKEKAERSVLLLKRTSERSHWRDLEASPSWDMLKSRIDDLVRKHQDLLLDMKDTQGVWETIGYIKGLKEIGATPRKEIVKLSNLIGDTYAGK